LGKPEIDDICGAKYTEDGLYYRARILDNNSAKEHLVRFIDYGNTATATEFVKLPEKLKNIKPFAWHCKFKNASILEWEESILKALEEYLFEENAYFKLEVVDKTADPIVVKLLKDREDVIELIPRLVTIANESNSGSEIEAEEPGEITGINCSEDVIMAEDCEQICQESELLVSSEYQEESNNLIFIDEVQQQDSSDVEMLPATFNKIVPDQSVEIERMVEVLDDSVEVDDDQKNKESEEKNDNDKE
jgi:hypothetical protein